MIYPSRGSSLLTLTHFEILPHNLLCSMASACLREMQVHTEDTEANFPNFPTCLDKKADVLQKSNRLNTGGGFSSLKKKKSFNLFH